MTRYPAALRLAGALLLLGAIGCGDKTTNNYSTTNIVQPPTTPVVPLDCTKQVYTTQPAVAVHTSSGSTGAATGTATLSGVVAANTFGVAGTTFTAVAASPTSSQFAVGASDAATATNLAAAINANATTKTVISAAAAGAVVTLTAIPAGLAGSFVAMTGTAGAFTLSGPTLSGGAGTGKALLTVDAKQFRDLNGNGKLDPYEDWRLLEICRAQDLLTRMTAPQKIALMSEGGTVGSGTADGTLPASAVNNVAVNNVRQALIRLGSRSAQELAVYLNHLQELCEAQPLGIPFVITTDPSHGFGSSTNASTGAMTLGASGVLSPWPYPMGLGAINDATVTRQYGDAVRHEFMAMGFRWQLGPMADLATEPRWARVQNVFGENAPHVAKHVQACVEGFQGSATGDLKNGIVATMKHFPGAGANEDGMDSHSYPGRFNVYPGNNFPYHQIPFQAAIDVGVGAVMPCYSIFREQWDYDPLQVGAAFSKPLITGYLKTTMGFTGMVTSDWGTMSGTSWGIQALTQPERAAMFVKAGSHQLGNDSFTIVQAAYDQGLLDDADIDGAAGKILEMSFKLGIFENPYVDPAAAATIVRSPQNLQDGLDAQKKAIVLLKNREHSTSASSGARYLPIDGARTAAGGAFVDDANGDGTISVFYDGVTDALAGTDIYSPFLADYDYRVASPPVGAAPVTAAATAATADIAVLRITARKGTYFGLDAGVPLSFDAPFPGTQNDGGLAAAIKDRNKVIDLFRIRDGYTMSDGTVVPAANPTLKIVLVVHMDRPPIVKPFVNGLVTLNETPGVPGSYPLVSDPANVRADGLGGVDALLVDFGAFDRAVLDFLFNKNAPAGFTYGAARLPVEIPSSDAEVDAQYEDLPNDTRYPTYSLGAGSGF